MNNLQIHNTDRTYDIPADWDELSPKQARAILKISARFAKGAINYNDFIIRSLYIIMNIKRNLRSIFKENLLPRAARIKKLDNIRLLADSLTAFLLTYTDDKVTLNYTATCNHFPKLRAGLKLYYGPDDLIANLTFHQFRSASNSIYDYQNSQDENCLWDAMAAIYLPAKPLLFIRRLFPSFNCIHHVTFNERKIKLHARRLKRFIPNYIRDASISMFENSVRYIMNDDLDIDGRTINLKPLFNSESSDDSGVGMLSTLYAVADQNAFGDVDKTDKRKFLEILIYLYNSHLIAEKQKSNLKSNE